MHVAYIHQHFSSTRGASGTRSYEMSRRLLLAGHQVTLVCGAYAHGDRIEQPQARVASFELDGIRIVRIAEPYSNEMGFARRLLAFGRFARTATRVVGGLDADLVFATSTPLTVGIPGMKAAKRLGVPFVFEVRDLWPELPIALGVLKNPLLIAYARRLERRIYHAAERVIALAPGIKEGICKTGYPEERVPIIPNSSDLELFKPSNERVQNDRFGSVAHLRLVFTGAHGLANGLDSVLDAVIELKRRGESGFHFVFIGEGGQRERLIERGRREELDSLIRWVNPMPKKELAQVLPRFDVGMMILKNVPSFYYGTSPNKFFDYIASGLPVLNNYPGWLADMIKEHRCGIVVPPDEPAAFADAVVWLRDHRGELQAMGERARALAEAQFSRDHLGDQLVQTLEAVYNESRRSSRRIG
jgi:glycosyltransferase involved in cell wall biosynthesis